MCKGDKASRAHEESVLQITRKSLSILDYLLQEQENLPADDHQRKVVVVARAPCTPTVSTIDGPPHLYR